MSSRLRAPTALQGQLKMWARAASTRVNQAPGISAPRGCLFRALELVEESGIEAEHMLRELLVVDRHLAVAHAGLGWVCYLRDSDGDSLVEAIAHFEKALSMVPSMETASVGLFQSLWCSDRADRALLEYERFSDNYGEEIYSEVRSNVEWRDSPMVAPMTRLRTLRAVR